VLESWQVLLAALLLSVQLFLLGQAAKAADVEPLRSGASAPDLIYSAYDDRLIRLSDFAAARVLVSCSRAIIAQPLRPTKTVSRSCIAISTIVHVALVAISPNDPRAVRLDELGYSD